MPNPTEQALLDLLHQEQYRNRVASASPTSPGLLGSLSVPGGSPQVPSISPVSPYEASLAEMQYTELLAAMPGLAAASLVTSPAPVLGLYAALDLARVPPRPPVEQEAEAVIPMTFEAQRAPMSRMASYETSVDFEVSGSTSLTSEELPDISDLFMGSREVQEAASVIGVDIGIGSDFKDFTEVRTTPQDITFDSEWGTGDFETAAPNPAARFQVGRQSPPPINFGRSQSSTDGEVVSQRSASGRFTPLPRAEAVRRVMPESGISTTPRRAPATEPIPARLPRVSAYARLGKVLPDD